MPYYRSEENYTTEEKSKLTKCLEVFDITPLIEEAGLNEGRISQDQYDVFKKAFKRRCLFTYGGCFFQGEYDSRLDVYTVWGYLKYLYEEISIIGDLRLSVREKEIQMQLY